MTHTDSHAQVEHLDAPAPRGVAARPTETLSGVALGGAVYGFATQVGLPQVVAGAVALVVAFGPLAVSRFVDAIRR